VRNAASREDAIDALNALLRAALQESSRRGDHFLLFGCDDRDPFAGALARMPRLSYRYELRSWHPQEPERHARPSDRNERLPDEPLYFDDPALS
jgi:hypothetical protein